MTRAIRAVLELFAGVAVVGSDHSDGMTIPQNPTRAEIGAFGEQLAVEHLEALGMTILARNWRCRYGDLEVARAAWIWLAWLGTEGDRRA